MAIAEEQNKPENLRLLVAMRRLYSEAKGSRGLRTVGSLVVGIPLPVLAAIVPSTQDLVAAVGFIWLVIAIVLMYGVERRRVRDATRVLEAFDVAVFSLPWNERVAGSRVDHEFIAAAVRRNREPIDGLADWYPAIADEVPYPVSVLVCQRAATVWDWRLRRSFAIALLSLMLLFAVSLVAFGLIANYTLERFLLALVIPTSSIFATGIAVALTHFDDVSEQRELQRRLDHDWQLALNDPMSLTTAECREHQNCRFNLRMKTLPIPDLWYRWLRDKYESDMRQAATSMVAEYQRTTVLP